MPELLDATANKPTQQDLNVLEGVVTELRGEKFLSVEGSTALVGPLRGADAANDKANGVAVISQRGIPYIVQPVSSAGGTSLVQGSWNWSTTTTSVAKGHVGVDTATWAIANIVRIAKETAAGGDTGQSLSHLNVGNEVYLQETNNAANWGRYSVTGLAIDRGDYFDVPVTHIDHAGVPPTNNRPTSVVVGAAGSQGAVGPAGPIGPVGPTGPMGPQGLTGANGAQGIQGVQGVKGDIGATGPQGVPGVDGPIGPMGTVYDTDQLGTIKSFSGKTTPTNWVLADGARYSQLDFSQGYDFAKQEADAGNLLWTYRATDHTFTVPNLTDKFILAPGANTIGLNGGESTHILLPGETAMKAHSHGGVTGNDSPDHQHAFNSNPLTDYSGGTTNIGAPTGGAGIYKMPSNFISGAQSRHSHSVTAEAATNGAAHNNMPPYVVVGQIVKLKSVTIDPGGAIVGPPGPMGTVYDTDQIGVIKTFAGKTIPTNWMLADGRSLLRSAYSDLFTAIGTVYGSADSTHFNVPDLRAKFVYGAVQSDLSDVGTLGGEATHKLTVAEMPSHSHKEYINAAGGGNAWTLSFTGQYQLGWDTGVTGGDQPHNNLPPYILIAQIIKATGVQVDSGGALKGADGVVGAPGGQTFTQIIGDGAATSFTITHGFSTRNVTVSVYRSATPFDEVEADVERTDLQTVTVRTLPTVPAVGEFTVLVAAAGTPGSLPQITIDGWHVVGAAGEVPFQNSWSSYGSGYQPAAFRKDPTGKVSIRGLVTGGVAGTAVPGSGVAWTLPVGYRPVNRVTSGGSLGGTPGQRLDVMPTGEVLMYNAGPGLPMGLDLIEFDTDSVLQTASVAAVPLEAWHAVGAAGEPAFQNSWVNYPGVGAAAGFRKYLDGRVRLRGVVQLGGVNSVIFTLPVGYRPPQDLRFTVLSANIPTYFMVAATGNCWMASGGSNVWCDLAAIEFDTDTVNAYTTGILAHAAPAWIPLPALQNGWVIYGGSAPSYAKDDLGYVQGKGEIQPGTVAADTIITTLPSGYRSGQRQGFSGWSNLNGGIAVYTNPDGTVRLGQSVTAGCVLNIGGMHFPTWGGA